MYYCSNSNCKIELSPERVEALQFLGKQPFQYTCVQCSCDKPIKALYPGFSGGMLIFTDKIGSEGIQKEDKEDKEDFNNFRSENEL